MSSMSFRRLRCRIRSVALTTTAMVLAGGVAHAQDVPAPAPDVRTPPATRPVDAPTPLGSASGADAANAPVTAASPASNAGVAPQEDVPTAESGIEEITVTARRVEENVQRVPIAITALTPKVLETANVYDQFSLLKAVPGLQNFAKSPGNGNITNVTRIRGLNGIANYFNDVRISDTLYTFYASFFDVASVQVLKGPQGTLFGAASNAGAVVLTPRKPGNDFSGYVNVQAGNMNWRSVEGALDIPIVKDTILLRLAAKDFNHDGYITDVISGYKFGKERYDIQRATLIVRASDRLESETLFQREHLDDFGQGAFVIEDFNLLPQFSGAAAQAAVNGMTVAQYTAVRDRVLAQQIALGPWKFQGWSVGCPATAISPATRSTPPGPNIESVIPQSCAPGQGRGTDYMIHNKTTWEFVEGLSVKNILGYAWGDYVPGLYTSSSNRIILQDTNPKDIAPKYFPSNFSEELQLIGKLMDGRLDFVSGVYYSSEYQRSKSPDYARFLTNLNDNVTRTQTIARSHAVYGQGNYRITDKFTATLGLRKTWDSIVNTQQVLSPTTLEVTRVNGGRGTPTGEGHFDALSYTAGVQYQANPDTMFYLTNAKGYSAGGLQNVVGAERYEPDTLNNLEAGVKTTFRVGDDLRVRLNSSIYYGWFSNVKVTTQVNSTIAGTTAVIFIPAVTNAAAARVKGFDLDFQAAYRDSIELRGFIGYTDNHYTRFPSFDPASGRALDLSDTPFLNNPPIKLGITPTYHLPVDRETVGDISIATSFYYTDEFWVNVGKPLVPTIPGDPNSGAICKVRRTPAFGYNLSADNKFAYKDCSPATYNVDLRVDWENFLGNSGLRLSLEATNVTNAKTFVGVTSSYDAQGRNTGYSPMPRLIYGSLRYSF